MPARGKERALSVLVKLWRGLIIMATDAWNMPPALAFEAALSVAKGCSIQWISSGWRRIWCLDFVRFCIGQSLKQWSRFANFANPELKLV